MTTSRSSIDLAAVRSEVERVLAADGGDPRVHPNGFVQLDLGAAVVGVTGHSGAVRRLHVWNPPGLRVPGRARSEGIHDHVFDMCSTVLVGTLRQRVYEFAVGTGRPHTHEVHRASYWAGGSYLVPTGVRGVVREVDAYDVPAGHAYSQAPWTFHETDPVSGLLVTVMDKRIVHEGSPCVLQPLGLAYEADPPRAAVLPTEAVVAAIRAALA